MSKRDLRKYLAELDKEQVEAQLVELYEKFPEVKTYYDFVFNPREEKLLREAKAKISNEYFPIKTKRAKLRRSTAQKAIKQFLLLGVEPHSTADLMLHNIEVAQKYSAKREMRYSSFYKSMLNSFEQVVSYSIEKGVWAEFRPRLESVMKTAQIQRWENAPAFAEVFERISTECD
ncbi:MAG: hypothetical protein IR153_11605 [Flavobacterium sp.]|nr:hypothetical protein [Flavobacterium sp.]